MNVHVTIGNKIINTLPNVSGMYSMYDRFYGPAVRVTFHNGHELSIVANPGFNRGARYASGDLCEIAVFDETDEFTQRFFTIADDVMGYCTMEEIMSVAERISNV